MSDQSGNIFSREHIEEITGSLQVDLGQDDHGVYHAKITAMQRLLRHGMSKFSKDKLYQHLCIVARRVIVQDRMKSWDAASKTVIKSIRHLREVVGDLHGKDKYNGLLETERQAVRFFQHFFVDVDYMRKFKQAYDIEIHTVLYYDYYNPPPPEVEVKDSSNVINPEDKDSGNYSQSELDEKHNQVKSRKNGKSPGTDGASPKGDVSPRNKCDDALSQVGFSFSKHLNGSEKEKLDVTVNELEEISERWDRLLLEDEQDLQDYDPESYYEVMELEDHVKFEAVFRLFPDMFAKCYKVIELTKQWWNLAHKIYKKLPLRRPVSRAWPRKPGSTARSEDVSSQQPEHNPENEDLKDECSDDDTENGEETRETAAEENSRVGESQKQQKHDRIKNIKARLFDLSFNIQALDEELGRCKVDIRKLDSRERRFQMLEILHGKVDANIEEMQEKCRKLRAQRKVVAQKYSYTFRGTEQYFEYREKLRRIDKKLVKYDQDMQLLVYKQAVVAQDYMLEMEIRPNFIRSYDDLRTTIGEVEIQLHEKTGERTALQEELELLEPNGVAGRSRRFENGSNSGTSDYSDLSHQLSLSQQPSLDREDTLVSSKPQSRNSGYDTYREVFSSLGKRFELVNSAPPVKTQLKEHVKREVTRNPRVTPRSETQPKSVMTIDGSQLGAQDKPKVFSPRPPPTLKRRLKKPAPVRRGLKPVT